MIRYIGRLKQQKSMVSPRLAHKTRIDTYVVSGRAVGLGRHGDNLEENMLIKVAEG